MSKLDKIEELQNLLKEDPQDSQLRRELAVLLIDTGFNEEALQHLLYLSKNFSHDEGIFYNLGIVYEKMKNFEKAKDMYIKTLEIKPDYTDARYNLGLVYTELREFDNAIECFNKVLEEDDNDSNTYFNIGLVYFKKKDYINSIQYFQRTIDLNDEDLYAHFYIGNIYKELGDNEAAKSEFEKVLEISPDYSWAYFNLASINNEEGNTQLAIENLIKTIEMNPKDREAYSILTKLYLREDMHDDAAKTITDCINECDPSGDVYYLAAMAFKTIDKEEYISYLSNAIKHYQSLSKPVQDVKDELNNARNWA